MKILSLLSIFIFLSIHSLAKDYFDQETSVSSSLKALQEKRADFAIITSDHAYAIKKSMPELRSVVALYPTILTFITRKESNISSILDLKEKNISVAFTSQGAKQLCQKMFSALTIPQTYKKLTFKEAKEQLKNKKLDGFFSLVAHPNQELKTLNQEQNITFVPLFGKVCDQLNSDYSYILKGGIPKNIYAGLEKDIKSIGVTTLLVTREDVNETLVYKRTKAMLNNMEVTKKSDPIYRGISRKSLLKGLTLQQHIGAFKAFNDL